MKRAWTILVNNDVDVNELSNFTLWQKLKQRKCTCIAILHYILGKRVHKRSDINPSLEVYVDKKVLVQLCKATETLI